MACHFSLVFKPFFHGDMTCDLLDLSNDLTCICLRLESYILKLACQLLDGRFLWMDWIIL